MHAARHHLSFCVLRGSWQAARGAAHACGPRHAHCVRHARLFCEATLTLSCGRAPGTSARGTAAPCAPGWPWRWTPTGARGACTATARRAQHHHGPPAAHSAPSSKFLGAAWSARAATQRTQRAVSTRKLGAPPRGPDPHRLHAHPGRMLLRKRKPRASTSRQHCQEQAHGRVEHRPAPGRGGCARGAAGGPNRVH